MSAPELPDQMAVNISQGIRPNGPYLNVSKRLDTNTHDQFRIPHSYVQLRAHLATHIFARPLTFIAPETLGVSENIDPVSHNNITLLHFTTILYL